MLFRSTLNVSGISTLGNITAANVSLAGVTTGLNNPGIGTIGFVQSTTLNVTGFSTLGSISARNLTLAGITTGLNAPGISTFGDTVVSDLFIAGITTGLNATGISTLANVILTPSASGVGATVGASVGVVTYYGDGSFLTGNARNLNATIELEPLVVL